MDSSQAHNHMFIRHIGSTIPAKHRGLGFSETPHLKFSISSHLFWDEMPQQYLLSTSCTCSIHQLRRDKVHLPNTVDWIVLFLDNCWQAAQLQANAADKSKNNEGTNFEN